LQDRWCWRWRNRLWSLGWSRRGGGNWCFRRLRPLALPITLIRRLCSLTLLPFH
jgi:hypothetical protein